jgi:alkylhydroperoxidase family enzyme
MTISVSLPSQLCELRPEAVSLLLQANESVELTTDPELLRLLRARIDTLVGDGSLAQELFPTGIGDLTDKQQVAINFAEQFIVDVSGVTEMDRANLSKYFPGESMRDFVTALYITEFSLRLKLISERLLGEQRGKTSKFLEVALDGKVDTRTYLKEYQDAVVRGTDLDPVTTELVRLRCARTHNCEICQTLRLANARAEGADDSMTAKVDFYETSDLDESRKMALRITDAFITRPDTLTNEMSVAAHSLYEPQQLAELCLDITKWSTQKIHVSLGIDSAASLPKNEQGISFFDFDKDGRVTGYSANIG